MIRLLHQGWLQSRSCFHAAAAAAAAQNPYLRSFATQNPNTPPPKSIATHLSETYNFSPSEALSISAHIHLKNPEPILSFLKDLGFTAAHIAKAIAIRPLILRADPERTLRPRWQYLHSLGLSRSDLADLFASNPALFYLTLRKKPTQSAVSCPHFDTLIAAGVPVSNILKMLQTQQRSLFTSVARLKEVVAEVQRMGVCPSKLAFARAIALVSALNKETPGRKRALYKSLGWSDDEIQGAFRVQPDFLALSDGNIKQKMEFLEGKVGLTPAELSSCPLLMMYSLRKRLVPRCSVMKALVGRGLIEINGKRICTVLDMPERKFLEKYVAMYEKEAPEVAKAAKGEIGFQGWDAEL